MKKITLVFYCLISISLSAQKFTKEKTSCLNAISQSSYSYTQQKDNPNVYWYKKYDEFGECLVQLTFDGNILRKVVFGHTSSQYNLNRYKDLFKSITLDETLSFDWTSSGNGYGKAYNTKYFTGFANYECDKQKYFFTIYPIY